MTIVIAYAPRPEGQAALEAGIEIALKRKQPLLVVNATPGDGDDDSMASAQDAERIERLLAATGLQAEFKQFGRGKGAVEEIEMLVETLNASLLVVGLRKRSAVGKLLLGSVARDLLLSVNCPVLCVKAPG